MKSFAEFRKSLSAVSQMLLVCLLVGLLVVFVVVMRSENPRWIFDLLGLSRIGGPETVAGNSKYEVLKFIGISMGGVLIALQAVIANKRAKAMDKTAQAQAAAAKAQARASEEQAKANWHTEQGQRQERLKNAIEHLGHESDSVRMGGAYELFHLARDTQGRDAKELRQTVLDILCTHIRWTSGKCQYQKTHESKPSEEVQSLLALLFVQRHEVFKGLQISLQGSWLNGADLRKACLPKANLSGTYIQGADLVGVRLQGSLLIEAKLQGTVLNKAWLQGANLSGAKMQRAHLIESRLQDAILSRCMMQVVDLRLARLQGAVLTDVQMQRAILSGAQMQGTVLRGAQMQEAILSEAQLRGAQRYRLSSSFAEHMTETIGRCTDLSAVVFEGGLSEEDADSITLGGSNESADAWRYKLRSHINRAESSQLPPNSGAIIKPPYTAQEAEEWIAEYEEAMSEIPRDDS